METSIQLTAIFILLSGILLNTSKYDKMTEYAYKGAWMVFIYGTVVDCITMTLKFMKG